MIAPSSDQSRRRCFALGSDTLKVIGSDPPVWNSTLPELKYQSNTSLMPSLRSATYPSSDMDMIATTFDTARSPWTWLKFCSDAKYARARKRVATCPAREHSARGAPVH